jgi:hypothetical protein
MTIADPFKHQKWPFKGLKGLVFRRNIAAGLGNWGQT